MIKTPNDMQAGTIHKTNNYGELVVVDYMDYSNVKVRFISTGFEAISQAGHVRSGKVKDLLLPSVFGVGFVGVGEHSASIGGIKTGVHRRWADMMRRCYSEIKLKECPTYRDCSVCEEWHNFQNFADWFEVNYVAGLHLDKDIKIKGNKVYSPQACLFVSQEYNSIEASAKTFTMKSPDGETITFYNMRKFCEENNLDDGHLCSVNSGSRKSHKGWTKAI